MLEVSFRLRGVQVAAAAAGLKGVDYASAVAAAREVRGGGRWISVMRPAALAANPRHLLTAVLYAASSYMEGNMVARHPEMELLLYLLGTRNIRSVAEEMRGEESVGAAAVSLGGDAVELLERYTAMLGARSYTPSPREWAEWYRSYLGRRGVRGAGRMDEEAILALLRARAALVRLSV